MSALKRIEERHEDWVTKYGITHRHEDLVAKALSGDVLKLARALNEILETFMSCICEDCVRCDGKRTLEEVAGKPVGKVE